MATILAARRLSGAFQRSLPGRALAGTARMLGSVALTFLGLLFVTFLIGRVIPIDPCCRWSATGRAGHLRGGPALPRPRPAALHPVLPLCGGRAARRPRPVGDDLPAGAHRHRRLLPGHARAGDGGDDHRHRRSACPAGVAAAVWRGRWPDQVIRVLGLDRLLGADLLAGPDGPASLLRRPRLGGGAGQARRLLRGPRPAGHRASSPSTRCSPATGTSSGTRSATSSCRRASSATTRSPTSAA